MMLTMTDIYIAVVSSAHNVCPKGYYIAIVSTIAESSANHHIELAPGFERLGRIEEKFMVSVLVSSSYFNAHSHIGTPNPSVRAFGERCQRQYLYF
jgi:RAB protein geranylgeranyltransferase component A